MSVVMAFVMGGWEETRQRWYADAAEPGLPSVDFSFGMVEEDFLALNRMLQRRGTHQVPDHPEAEDAVEGGELGCFLIRPPRRTNPLIRRS